MADAEFFLFDFFFFENEKRESQWRKEREREREISKVEKNKKTSFLFSISGIEGRRVPLKLTFGCVRLRERREDGGGDAVKKEKEKGRWI